MKYSIIIQYHTKTRKTTVISINLKMIINNTKIVGLQNNN